MVWLAGLLEGEGAFMCGPPSNPGAPVVAVQMTDRDVIERASILMSVKMSCNRPQKHKIRGRRPYKPTFSARLRGERAVVLMKELKPLMGQRRQSQIDRALNSWCGRCVKRCSLPSSERLRVLLKKYSTRDLGRRFKCAHQTIHRRAFGR